MSFHAYYSISVNRGAPRFWVETQKLDQINMPYGTPLLSSVSADGLELTLNASALGDRHVSRKRANGGFRPLIDICSRDLLGRLQPYREIKVVGSDGRLVITPSVRARRMYRQRTTVAPFPILECCAGGGFMGQAFAKNPAFRIAAGIEIEPAYADEWIRKNPFADLFLGNITRIHPSELPFFAGILVGIPCVEHCQLGRAKKGLAGQAILGDAGAVFVSVLEIIAYHMPLFGVFENSPSFGHDLAGGQLFVKHLQDLGYETHDFIMAPHRDWAEPTTRNRWVCIATLKNWFSLQIPGVPFTGTIKQYLDQPDPVRDERDAKAFAGTYAGLQIHNARHSAQGHRFRTRIVTGEESEMPTIPSAYHKGNSSGAFVATPWGPRKLRQAEIARLHSHEIFTDHYATAVELSGQGVLSHPFELIANQIASHLCN